MSLVSITWNYVQEQWSETSLRDWGLPLYVLIRMRYRPSTRSGIRVTDADRSGILRSAYIRLLLLLGSNLSVFWSNLRIRHSQNHPFLSNYRLLLGHDVIGVQSWPLIEKITPSKIHVLPMLLTQVNQRFHCLVGISLYPTIQKYAIKKQERKKQMLHNWLSNPYISYLFCKRKKVTRRSLCNFSSECFNIKFFNLMTG